MFFGRYDYTIDAKGRLNFPAKFRDAMGESFVVLEWVDNCLFVLPLPEVEKLAEKLEVSPTHVKHIESGHRKPSIEILFEIAKILNISLDSVVFSKNESAHTDTREKIDRLLDISDEASLRFILSVLEALREKEQAGVR